MRVLLVEDEPDLGQAVQEHLASQGYAVDWTTGIGDADAALATMEYGAALLDLNLPDGGGLDLLKTIRRRGDTTPVIVITAMDQISDRIAGLNAGADDYLVKPFDLDELGARIQAVTRRYVGNPNPIEVLGDLEIDTAGRQISRGGEEVSLTRREWSILDLLIRRPGAIVPKERIEAALYEFGAEIESNSVEVHVSRLRRKLGRERILTARGLGYKIDPA